MPVFAPVTSATRSATTGFFRIAVDLGCGRGPGRAAGAAGAAQGALLRGGPDARGGSPARVQLLDLVGHQDRVDELAAAAVVALAVPLALEAEGLVQRERSVVPGEDVQLELAHTRLPRPLNRGLH